MATVPSTTTYYSEATMAPRSQGKDIPFIYEEEFDLDALYSTVLANADVVNLIALPANYVILASSLKIVTAGTKNATTFTLQLREATTALSAALDATTANGRATGGNATYNHPLSIGTSAVAIDCVVVCSGGSALVTKNPKIKVKLLLIDMA